MYHKSCENCCFRDNKICLRFSKNVNVIIDGKKQVKGTFLNIEKNWVCNKFVEAMCVEAVMELNRELEKDE